MIFRELYTIIFDSSYQDLDTHSYQVPGPGLGTVDGLETSKIGHFQSIGISCTVED